MISLLLVCNFHPLHTNSPDVEVLTAEIEQFLKSTIVAPADLAPWGASRQSYNDQRRYLEVSQGVPTIPPRLLRCGTTKPGAVGACPDLTLTSPNSYCDITSLPICGLLISIHRMRCLFDLTLASMGLPPLLVVASPNTGITDQPPNSYCDINPLPI